MVLPYCEKYEYHFRKEINKDVSFSWRRQTSIRCSKFSSPTLIVQCAYEFKVIKHKHGWLRQIIWRLLKAEACLDIVMMVWCETSQKIILIHFMILVVKIIDEMPRWVHRAAVCGPVVWGGGRLRGLPRRLLSLPCWGRHQVLRNQQVLMVQLQTFTASHYFFKNNCFDNN